MFDELLAAIEWHVVRPPATAGRQELAGMARAARARVTALARLAKARQQTPEQQNAARLGAMTRAADLCAIDDGETRRKTAADVLAAYLRG
jgi:hypothetical protein